MLPLADEVRREFTVTRMWCILMVSHLAMCIIISNLYCDTYDDIQVFGRSYTNSHSYRPSCWWQQLMTTIYDTFNFRYNVKVIKYVP